MADRDRALELARTYNPSEFKMRPIGDIYRDARQSIADKYNAFMGNPIVQAFGEEPMTMTKAVGSAAVDLAKMAPGAAKSLAQYAYENPSEAAGKAVELGASMSAKPAAMFLWGPGGMLDPTEAKASEISPELAQRHAMSQEAQLMREGYAGGYAEGGEVRQAYGNGSLVRSLLSGEKSFLTQLAEDALKRRGAQTAMRVERAADEIPNLERQYTPDALREALLSNEGLVMTMKPGDFQKFAQKLPPQTGAMPLAEGELPHKYSNRDEYLRYLSQFPVSGGGGFKDVPYLAYGTGYGAGDAPRFSSIVGHEGRHRMLALEGLDEPSTLVQLQPAPTLKQEMKDQLQEKFPYRNPYDDERLITQFKSKVYGNPQVIPEKRTLDDFNLIDLPEPYAEGGATYPLRDHTDWEESLDYEKSGGHLTHMSPDKFLEDTTPLKMNDEDIDIIQHFKDQIEKHTKLDPLAIDKNGKPNGRHRAHAAKELGIKKIPVVTGHGKKDGGTIVKRAIMLVSKKA